jgi:HlyD family secretion protein
MDRVIDRNTQRRRQLLRVAWTAALFALAALALSWAAGLIRPSIARSQVRTSSVDEGPVDATLSATGVVVPEVEQVISSAVDARVLKVLRRAGAPVRRGDPIVRLDISASVLAVERLDEDLALKANQQARSKLTLANTLSELDSQVEIKKLQLESARLEVRRDRQLFGEGLVSEETLRRAEVAETQAAIELKRLEAARENAGATTRTELEGLALEMSKLRKERDEARRVLELATTVADRDGVLTWTITDEGATVRQGDVLARLADLSAFRVDASVSDAFAGRVSAGMPVQVRVDTEVLEARVSEVLPTVQNGVLTVRVALADRSHARLRPNLRVEVFIVTGHRARARRVRKGPSTGGEGVQPVFVLRDGRADRARVRFGIASFDYVEVIEGLEVGDEIVVSDMTDYQHLESIRLR